MKHILLYILLIHTMSFSLLTSAVAQEEQHKEFFTLPHIPDSITLPKQRAEYLATHYWENFNFKNLSLIASKEGTEQAFVNFATLLPIASYSTACNAINALLDYAIDADSLMFAHFFSLTEKYFYDIDSPLRNDKYFIPVLQYVTSSKRLSDAYMIRASFLLQLLLKNRVGEKAMDFIVHLEDGEPLSLSSIETDYTLLFFNNPDCADCTKAKEFMNGHEIFSDVEKLSVLAVYTDGDFMEWKSASYPSWMINGNDATMQIRTKNLYNLREMPTFYLLDKDKRVVLKDADIEQVYEYLNE